MFLVTGGAGFIGANLVESLLRAGIAVRVLDNLTTGRSSNIDEFRSDIEFIEGDIRDLSTLESAMDGVDVVFHEAALPSVPRSLADPILCNEVNVGGTLNVLIAARAAGVGRLVYASSSSVYGDTPALPKVESMAPLPLSPYAVSKLAGERYCHAFTSSFGLPTISLRYFNVFGPRQDPDSTYAAVVPKFISAMAEGRQPIIYGDGKQCRDFTFVDDVVEANLIASKADAAVSGCFNVAPGNRTSLLELVGKLNRILGTAIDPVHEPARKGDIRDSQAGVGLIREMLGFTPSFTLENGLQRTIEYLVRGNVTKKLPAR